MVETGWSFVSPGSRRRPEQVAKTQGNLGFPVAGSPLNVWTSNRRHGDLRMFLKLNTELQIVHISFQGTSQAPRCSGADQLLIIVNSEHEDDTHCLQSTDVGLDFLDTYRYSNSRSSPQAMARPIFIQSISTFHLIALHQTRTQTQSFFTLNSNHNPPTIRRAPYAILHPHYHLPSS